MSNIEWSSVEFGDGKFQVSNHGDVKNILTNKILSPRVQNSGYKIVHLNHSGKRKALLVHRLVAIAFVPNTENKPFVNHIDGNKLNNASYNLEWVTPSENMRHAQNMGLMDNKNSSASKRMSAIGKAFSTVNKARLLEISKERRKPVLQLSLTGEFIKEWPSVRSVRNSGVAANVGKVLKGEYIQAGGFKWAWK
jgi:hypothetical protein